jgi:hypothetical protein
MLRTTPPAQIPDRHADYFLAKLKKEHPKLDDDVANLLRDVARFRAKLGVLQNFFAGMPTDELSDYDTRYNWLVSATQWAAEYREAKKSVQSPLFDPPFCFTSLFSSHFSSPHIYSLNVNFYFSNPRCNIVSS